MKKQSLLTTLAVFGLALLAQNAHAGILGGEGGKQNAYEIVTTTGMGLAEGDLAFQPNENAERITQNGTIIEEPAARMPMMESLYSLCHRENCLLRKSADGNFFVEETVKKHRPMPGEAKTIVGTSGADRWVYIKKSLVTEG